MHRLRHIALSLVWLLLFVAIKPGCAATIDIKGRVINGTHEAGAKGASVELWRLSLKSGEHAAKLLGTTTADAQGNFGFPNIQVAADDLLTVRSNWQGYPYEMPAYDGAGRIKTKFGLEVDPGKILLEIFDQAKTFDLVERVHHLAIESKPQGIKCTERIVIENATKQVYLGEGQQQISYRLALPAGAYDVKLDPKITNATLIPTGDGYGISMPILPSSPQDNSNALILSYMIDWPGKLPWQHHVDLSRKLIYPVRFFFVNRGEADRGLDVAAPQLGPDQDQEIPSKDKPDGKPDVRIVNSKGSPMDPNPAFAAGTQVAVNVSRPTNSLFWAFLMFLAALCLMVPLALLGRPKAGREALTQNRVISPEPNAASFVIQGTSSNWSAIEPGSSARDLIEKLAQLDEEWERGAVSAPEYRARRSSWKSELVQALASQEAGLRKEA